MTALEADYAAQVLARALSDTGYFCREVLGYNSDKNEETGEESNKGEGGVRRLGPHAQMIDFLDDQTTRYKHLEAPRGSYKSSILCGYAMRRALANRNLRVLYAMKTYSEATKKVASIRDMFAHYAAVEALFGKVRTPKWSSSQFTIAGRTRILPEPTFTAGGPDKNVTGGHFDLIICDDIVTWDNVNTPENIQKVWDWFKMVQPLLDPGGTLIVCGTRYSRADLYGTLLEQNKTETRGRWAECILDCGMYLVEEDDGTYSLEGKARFAHLTENVLWEKFVSMKRDVRDFASQYLNQIRSAGAQYFRRSHFQHCKWEPHWMQYLTGYCFTDTAASEKESACYYVSAIVGFDGVDNAYVLDVLVGHFPTSEYVSRTMDMISLWSSRIDIRGMTLEKTAANEWALAQIHQECRARQMRAPKIHRLSRRGANKAEDDSKERRIQALHTRCVDGKLYICDTVPRMFKDAGRDKILYDPELYRPQPDQPALAGGELIDEFIYFRQGYKNDIADALADIDYVDPQTGRRMFQGLGQRAREQRDLQQQRSQGIIRAIPMMIQGKQTYVDVVPSQHRNNQGHWASDFVRRKGLKRK